MTIMTCPQGVRRWGLGAMYFLPYSWVMARRLLLVLAGAISAVACIVMGFYLFVFSIPIYTGMLFADYPDPARPGHLKGVTISGPELTLQIAGVIILSVVTVRLFRYLAAIRLPEQALRSESSDSALEE